MLKAIKQTLCYIRTGHTFDEGPGRYNATCFHCGKKNPHQVQPFKIPEPMLLTGEIGDQPWLPPNN